MKQVIRLGAMVGVLLGLAACQPPTGHDGQATTPMEMKVYAVPPAQTGRLAAALGGALGGHASVSDPAPGKLLVYAPRDAQASIATALAGLARAASSKVVPVQVNVRFWVVDARPGAGPDDPALKSLAAKLDPLRTTFGPLHFELEQSVATLAASNQDGSISTTTGSGPRTFGFRLGAVEGDGVPLSLDYQDGGRSGLRQLRTEVGARFGEYLVLAQAPGVCSHASDPTQPASADTCPDKPALRLLIVRVDRPNPSA